MTIWIYTGDRPSNGAKELSQAPGFKRLRTGKWLKPKDIIVNWGSSKPVPWPARVLNTPKAVSLAANKFFTFSSLAGADVSIVPWTANMAVAQEWLDAGSTVVVRQTLTGHSGDGIIILETVDEQLIEAPLYTKYVFKVREYRVHATQTGVIDTQQKVRDPDTVPKTWKVRSHANGFIFQRKNIAHSDARNDLAVKAIQALGLDFGAVDIIEDKAGKFYVLEVNTSPGLEGQTIESYQQALQELANAPYAQAEN